MFYRFFFENVGKEQEELEKFFEDNDISRYTYTNNLKPATIQVGDTCGFSSFDSILRPSMPDKIQIGGKDFEPGPDLLLYIATQWGYTEEGEMVNPKYFVDLGLAFGLHVEVERGISESHYERRIRTHIPKNPSGKGISPNGRNVMAVADIVGEKPQKNRKGFYAHWIVIIGYCDIKGQMHVISTDGNPGIKIFPLSDLWEATCNMWGPENSGIFRLRGKIVVHYADGFWPDKKIRAVESWGRRFLSETFPFRTSLNK